MAKRYDVYSGDDLALEIEDTPGPLVSISAPPPPPGSTPAPHPFLTGTAHLALEEHHLRQLLDQSSNTADYLKRLEADGYRVVERT